MDLTIDRRTLAWAVRIAAGVVGTDVGWHFPGCRLSVSMTDDSAEIPPLGPVPPACVTLEATNYAAWISMTLGAQVGRRPGRAVFSPGPALRVLRGLNARTVDLANESQIRDSIVQNESAQPSDDSLQSDSGMVSAKSSECALPRIPLGGRDTDRSSRSTINAQVVLPGLSLWADGSRFTLPARDPREWPELTPVGPGGDPVVVLAGSLRVALRAAIVGCGSVASLDALSPMAPAVVWVFGGCGLTLVGAGGLQTFARTVLLDCADADVQLRPPGEAHLPLRAARSLARILTHIDPATPVAIRLGRTMLHVSWERLDPPSCDQPFTTMMFAAQVKSAPTCWPGAMATEELGSGIVIPRRTLLSAIRRVAVILPGGSQQVRLRFVAARWGRGRLRVVAHSGGMAAEVGVGLRERPPSVDIRVCAAGLMAFLLLADGETVRLTLQARQLVQLSAGDEFRALFRELSAEPSSAREGVHGAESQSTESILRVLEVASSTPNSDRLP
jgi:hypothetical protein